MKVLLVDDMRIVYEAVKSKLGGKYNISYAETEEQALGMIKKNIYDIVAIDYHLGIISPKGGLEIVKAAKNKGLRVILMSKENHKKEASEDNTEFIFKKELASYLIQNG